MSSAGAHRLNTSNNPSLLFRHHNELYSQADLRLLATILSRSTIDIAEQHNDTAFLAILRTYDTVLRERGLDPATDVIYYRFLLRLSLLTEAGGWWERFEKVVKQLGLRVPEDTWEHKSIPFFDTTQQKPNTFSHLSTTLINSSKPRREDLTASFIIEHATLQPSFRRTRKPHRIEKGIFRNFSEEHRVESDHTTFFTDTHEFREKTGVPEEVGHGRWKSDALEASEILNSRASFWAPVDDDAAQNAWNETDLRSIPPLIDASTQQGSTYPANDASQPRNHKVVPEPETEREVLHTHPLKVAFNMWKSQIRRSKRERGRLIRQWILATETWRAQLLRQTLTIWRLRKEKSQIATAEFGARHRLQVLRRWFRRIFDYAVGDRVVADGFRTKKVLEKCAKRWRVRTVAKVALENACDRVRERERKRKMVAVVSAWKTWTRIRRLQCETLLDRVRSRNKKILETFWTHWKNETYRHQMFETAESHHFTILLSKSLSFWKRRAQTLSSRRDAYMAMKPKTDFQLLATQFSNWKLSYSDRLKSRDIVRASERRVVVRCWTRLKKMVTDLQKARDHSLNSMAKKVVRTWKVWNERKKVLLSGYSTVTGSQFVRAKRRYILHWRNRMRSVCFEKRSSTRIQRTAFRNWMDRHGQVSIALPRSAEVFRDTVAIRQCFQFWKLRREEIRCRMDTAEDFQSIRIQQMSFSTWRTELGEHVFDHTRALEFGDWSIRKRWFEEWKSRFRESRIRWREQRCVQHILDEWRALTNRRKFFNEQCSAFASRRDYCSIRSSFHSWRNRSRATQIQEAVAKSHRERFVERRFFRQWYRTAHVKRFETLLVYRFKATQKRLAATRACVGWHSWAKKKSRERCATGRFIRKVEQQVLKKGWSGWREAVKRKRVYGIESAYLEAHDFCTKRSVFTRWHSATTDKIANRHHVRKLLGSVFREWRMRYKERRDTRKADGVDRKRLENSAFRFWDRTYIQNLTLVRRGMDPLRLRNACFFKIRENVRLNCLQISTSGAFRRDSLLRRCFGIMRRTLDRRRRNRIACQMFLSRIDRGVTFRVWKSWRTAIDRVSQIQEEAETVRRNGVLKRFFEKWTRQVREIRARESEAMLESGRDTKKRSLRVWIEKFSVRQQKEEQRRRIEVYQRALNFAAGSLLRRVLRSWNRNVLEHKRVLYVKEMDTRKVRMRTAFVVWRNYLRLRDREYEFRVSKNKRQLASVWRAWKSREGILRRLAVTISDQFGTRRNANVVKSGFRKWKSRWIRTVRARTRYEDSVVRHAFRKWRAVAAERGLHGTASAVYRNRMLRRAWSMWKGRVSRIVKERRIEVVVGKVRKRELKEVFTAFRNYVRKKHATRNVVVTMLPRMAKIRQDHSNESHLPARVYCPWLLRKTFFTWKRQLKIRLAKNKEMDSTAVAYRSAIEWRIQRRALIRWQSKLSEVCQKRRLGMLRRMAFVRWHQWSQSSKAMKLDRMAHVFDRWQDHIRAWQGNAAVAASFDSKSLMKRVLRRWKTRFLKLTEDHRESSLAYPDPRPLPSSVPYSNPAGFPPKKPLEEENLENLRNRAASGSIKENRAHESGSRVTGVEESHLRRVSICQEFDRRRNLKYFWTVWKEGCKTGIFDRERKLIFADTWADLSLKRRTLRTLATYLSGLRNERFLKIGHRVQGKEKEQVELDGSEDRSMRFRAAQRVLMKVGGP